MKKSDKLKKELFESLEKVPNTSLACEKVGITRQTFYRWMDEDINFLKSVNRAQKMGNEYLNDLAESALINNIKSGKKWSIKYWLDNHKYNYMKPRPKEIWNSMAEENRKMLGGWFIVDKNGRVDYYDSSNKKYETNMKEGDRAFEEIRERYDTITWTIMDGEKKDDGS